MKTFGILILIPIVLAIEVILSIGTVTLYLFITADDGLLTQKLINKLD